MTALIHTPFNLVEVTTLQLPSPSHSFNSLRVCFDSEHNFALLSTSLHTARLQSSSVSPFTLTTSDIAISPKPKKIKKKHQNKQGEIAPVSLPPHTQQVVASDVIGGNGADWEKYGSEESGVEAIAVQRKDVVAGGNGKCTYYLKIRRLIPTSTDDVQIISIPYSPVALHLTYLPLAGRATLTLLVSSSDSTIRIYQPVLNNNGLFEEVTDEGVREKLLPKLHQTFPSPVLTMDTLLTPSSNTSSSSTFHVSCGCRCGYLCVISYDPSSPSSDSFTSWNVDGPISTIQISRQKKGNLSLLVASLAGYVCTYIRESSHPYNWGSSYIFPESVDPSDPAVSVCSAPFPTLSGSAIFVGTAKGKVLVFTRSTSFHPTPSPPYLLSFTLLLPSPIRRLAVGDVNGDGLPSVLVMTSDTCTVYRRRLEEVKEMGEFKLRLIGRKGA